MAFVVAAASPACIGGGGPQPTPRDVLLVGDSIGFGIGCYVLGDRGTSDNPCPHRSFTAANAYIGGCAISPGYIIQYNRVADDHHSCWNYATYFKQQVDQYRPKLVVLMTGGWEIVDRWRSLPTNAGCSATNTSPCSPGADRQWGGAGDDNPYYANAVANYLDALRVALDILSSRGARVLILTQPYLNPPEPASPDRIGGGTYWEPYPETPPPGYEQPNVNTPYASSRLKVDRFNGAIWRAHDPNLGIPAAQSPGVEIFDFWRELSPVINGVPEYSDWQCDYPNNRLDPDVACPDPPGGFNPERVLVRGPEKMHPLPAGYAIVSCYMLPIVHEMLGIAPPSPC